MLYAYTFMVSDRASVKQCGHHPQKGYLHTLGHMVCGKTLLDQKNRMMVPILAPVVPCFQSSHENSGSKIMNSSGHGQICLNEGKNQIIHPETFFDTVQFMMRFYHVHLDQKHEISDHDVLNKIQKPNFAIASIAILRALGDKMDALADTHTPKAFIGAMEHFLEVLIQEVLQYNMPTDTHTLNGDVHNDYLSIWK